MLGPDHGLRRLTNPNDGEHQNENHDIEMTTTETCPCGAGCSCGEACGCGPDCKAGLPALSRNSLHGVKWQCSPQEESLSDHPQNGDAAQAPGARHSPGRPGAGCAPRILQHRREVGPERRPNSACCSATRRPRRSSSGRRSAKARSRATCSSASATCSASTRRCRSCCLTRRAPMPGCASRTRPRPFGGASALERMLGGNVGDLYVVRQYLDAQRG